MPEHHQRLALQIRDPHAAAPAGPGPGRRRDHHQVLLEQLDRGQGRGGRGKRKHHQGQIQGAARQLPYQVVRTALLQQQLDAGVQIVEGAQHVGQQPRADAGRRTEPDPAPAQLGQLLDLVPGGVRIGQDAPGQRQQRLARVGQCDVPAGAAEQLGSQLGLQCPDLLREGGL